MLPKIAKPQNSGARGRGRGKAGRGRGGRDGGDRSYPSRQTEGRKDSESGTDAADAAPAERPATPSAKKSPPPVRPARTPARRGASDAPVDLHCADACLCCQFTDRLVQGSPIRSPFGGLPRCNPSAQCRKCLLPPRRICDFDLLPPTLTLFSCDGYRVRDSTTQLCEA